MSYWKNKEKKEVEVDWGFVFFVVFLLVLVFTLILCLIWRGEKLLEWIRQFCRDLRSWRWQRERDGAVEEKLEEVNGPPAPPQPPRRDQRTTGISLQQGIGLSSSMEGTEDENSQEVNGSRDFESQTDSDVEGGERSKTLRGDLDDHPINKELFKESRV